MIDNAIEGILVHKNFRPLYVNHAFAKLFKYQTSRDILELPLIRPLCPLDEWPQIESNYESLLHDHNPRQIVRMRGLTKNGDEIWLSTTHRVIDWHGEKAVQITAQDISTQVALEQVLLGNEQLLRSVLEILPVPIFIARRRDGRIQFVNRKTCLLFSQSAGPLLKSKADSFFVDPEEQEKIYQLIDTIEDVREVEAQMKSSQGRCFTAEIAAIKMEYGGEPATLFSMNDISARKKLEEELFHQANTDALTGLSNRRHFIFQAEQEIRRAKRFNRELSVIMMDLDHFKKVNDEFGHAIGDIVLATLAKASLESLRASDIIGRVGGEEFAVLLPETGLTAAQEVAERILQHVQETPIKAGRKTVHCTTSLGVAHMTIKDKSIDDILVRADKALYKAKETGRNRIVVQKH
ncbi:MAG: diguanylate cyclase [Bdellovibrionales bacterium]